MAKYENLLKCAQIRKLVDEKRFRKAARIIEGMDINSVKSVTDLNAIAEVYIKTDQFDAAKETYERIYARAKSRRVLFRLIYLSIRNNELAKADRYYEEYVQLDPDNSDRLILRYRIDKARDLPRTELIKTLEQLKREDYMEEWGYELAKQYHREGMAEACVRECSDIILWFGEGEIVEKALRLKEFYTGANEDGTRRYFDTRENIDEMLKTQPIPILNPDGLSLPDSFLGTNPGEEVQETGSAQAMQVQAPQTQATDEAAGTANPNTIEVVSHLDDLVTPAIPAKEEDLSDEDENEEPFPQIRLTPEQEAELMHHSRSGTGITLDLAKEISAIVEAEQSQQQLSEKETKVELEDTGAYPITESLRLTPEEEAKLAALEEKEPSSAVPLENVAGRMEQALDRMMAGRIPDDTKSDASLEEIIPGPMNVPVGSASLQPSVNAPIEPAPLQASMDVPAEPAPLQASMDMPAEPAMEVPAEAAPMPLEPVLAPETESVPDKKEVSYFSKDLSKTPVIEYEEPSEKESFPPITTMALRLSFQDILTMIGADPEPTHFVLITGNLNPDTTLGVTKQIIKTINGKGYINASQIARITAEKLNMINLDANAGKLRGGCLLVENASALSIPTVGAMIKMIEEFGPELVVILADEGETLEMLFARALPLNRRFKYVIDITNYTEVDYE